MAATIDNPFTTAEHISVGHRASPTADTASASSVAASHGTMPTRHHTGTTADDDLVSRVAHGAHETIDRLAATVSPHVQRLQQGFSGGGQYVKEAGDEWTESLRCTVRHNPLAAVATATALGVLLARLTR